MYWTINEQVFTSVEQVLNKYQISHEQVLSKYWKNMDKSWTRHEQVMSSSGTCNDKNKSETSFEHVMNKLGANWG